MSFQLQGFDHSGIEKSGVMEYARTEKPRDEFIGSG